MEASSPSVSYTRDPERVKIAPVLRWTLGIFIVCLFLAFVCACMTIHGGVVMGDSLGIFYEVWGAISLVLFMILLGLFITLWVVLQKNLDRLKGYAFQWGANDSWSDFLTRCLESNLVRETEPSYVSFKQSLGSRTQGVEMGSMARPDV
jgi:hypothetical protein